jgi:cysteine-rich repeat protein
MRKALGIAWGTWAALGLLVTGGCTTLLGIDDDYQPVEASAGSAGTSTSSSAAGGTGGAGTGATGGGGQGGGSGGTGASTTSTTGGGGTGGAPPVCGNGLLEGNEICDDANDVQGDGCHECLPDCGCEGCVEGTACADCPAAGQTTFKDLATGHCYVNVPISTPWADARMQCQSLGAGWDLVAPSSDAEMDMLSAAPGLPIANQLNAGGKIWTGGTDQFSQGTFMWINGEAWLSSAQGGLLVESVLAGEHCLQIGGTGGNVTLRGNECIIDHEFACERSP